MQSISTGLGKLLNDVAPNQAKSLRIAQNNQRFASAVLRTWADNPDAAAFVLARVNALYIKQDEHPRTGPDKDKPRYELHVHLDDALARSELNARRETLLFALAREGMHLAGIIMHPSTGSVRAHRVFPDALKKADAALGNAPADDQGSTPREPRPSTAQHKRAADQRMLLETLKRALCISFDRLEVAEALLDRVQGAALVPTVWEENRRQSRGSYTCHLFVSKADVSTISQAIAARRDVVRDRARSLQLRLYRFEVHESPAQLEGKHAFPHGGLPMPLSDEQMEALITARTATPHRGDNTHSASSQ